MFNVNSKIMEKKFSRMSEKDIQVAEMYAVHNISWEDVKFLLGHMVPQREQDVKDYAAEYAVESDLFVFNYNLKSPNGFKLIEEHARLLADEYDLDVEDLSVATVINSLSIYVATGMIVL